MDERSGKVLSRLENQCARREYCRSDVMAKAIKALEGDAEAAEEVVASLVKDGYVDELRYATAFAREKSSLTGWGPYKIKLALGAKRISRDVIESALAGIDCDRADSRLEKLLEARWRVIKEDPQARLKLLKYALARGYEYDDVEAAVRRLTGN